jgi:deazaflavin-dependent oxidoreductase (nitroreductase family)
VCEKHAAVRHVGAIQEQSMSKVQEVVGRISAKPWFRPFAVKVAPAIDRGLSRATRGRFVLSQIFVPTLVLTHTGAKSGQTRVSPLACLPESEDAFLVVGSNQGAPTHPAWSHNLLAHPRVRVMFRGTETPADATLLEGAERAEAWTRLTKHWPSYAQYQELSGRELRVFRLSRVRSGA